MAMALWFARCSVLLEIGFFLVYKERHKQTHQGGLQGPNSHVLCGQEVGPCCIGLLGPRGSSDLLLWLKLILLHINFYGIFSQIYFRFLHE
jgi:hypothetical protein